MFKNIIRFYNLRTGNEKIDSVLESKSVEYNICSFSTLSHLFSLSIFFKALSPGNYMLEHVLREGTCCLSNYQ